MQTQVELREEYQSLLLSEQMEISTLRTYLLLSSEEWTALMPPWSVPQQPVCVTNVRVSISEVFLALMQMWLFWVHMWTISRCFSCNIKQDSEISLPHSSSQQYGALAMKGDYYRMDCSYISSNLFSVVFSC